MARIRSALGFAAILGSCLAGAFGLSVWAIGAAAATLLLLSLGMHQEHYARYAGAGNVRAQTLLMLGSTLNAATAAAIAFVLGRAIGWLWGL
jgi:hypothetical protein